MERTPISFPISTYGTEEKVTDTISKKRVRIFYKGMNRNHGYITDEFAEKLVKTLPYAPVKGIYNKDSEDFTDHGKERTEGRIYGVVPQDTNFAWEKHLDDDGVERTYACCDVYLYTALYGNEARKIGECGQSMELYPESIQGEWIEVEGIQAYKYSDACFLGLQALGKNVTPCFEGSAFYSKMQDTFCAFLVTLFAENSESEIGGKLEMENNTDLCFTLSDNQKQSAIGKALNAESIRYYVIDTMPEYAIVFDFETEKTFKFNYTKDENDVITVAEEGVELFGEYVTADEKKALDTLRNSTEEKTFSAAVADVENKNASIESLNSDLDAANATISEKDTTIEEMQGQINDKEAEISTLNTEKERVDNENVEIKEENVKLKAFKLSKENEEKKALLNKFENKLNATEIENFTNNLENYTYEELKREIAVSLLDANASIFSLDNESNEASGRVPQESFLTGVNALIAKHKTQQ